MRQAGIIAAGAVYALNHHVERLAEDNENAQILARVWRRSKESWLNRSRPTSSFRCLAMGVTAEAFNALLMEKGLRVSVLGKTREEPSLTRCVAGAGEGGARHHPAGCRPDYEEENVAVSPDALVAAFSDLILSERHDGPVLDLASGDGHNGLFLAAKGLPVILAIAPMKLSARRKRPPQGCRER